MAEITPSVKPDVLQKKTPTAAIDPRAAEADRFVEQGEQAIRQALSARSDGYQWESAEQAKFFQSALRSFQSAYRLYRDRGDRRGEARALGKMGYAYSLLNDKEKQEEAYQQQVRLYRDLKDREGETKTLEQLGNLYQNQRNNRKALATYQQLLNLHRAMKNFKGEADTLHTLGWFYIALKEPSKADRYFQQSFRLEKQINGRVPIDRVNDVTNYFYEMEDYVRGIQYDRQLLSLYREMKNREAEMGVLYNLGNAYYRSGNYGKALEPLQQSLSYTREKKDRETEALLLNQLGRVYDAFGNNGKAMEHYQQSLAITQTLGDRHLVLRMALTSDIGLALFKSGKLAAAEQSLRESIQWHELVLQQLNNFQKAEGYAENPLKGWNGYQTLQRVLIAQKQVQAALEVSEQGRARAYSELLLQRTQGKAPDQFQPIRIAEIQQVAREQNATLVEYAHIKEERSPTKSEEYLFIWVIQPTGQITFRQVDLSPLKQQNTSLDNLVMATRCLGVVACETTIKSRGSQPIAFNVAQSNQQFNELAVPSPTNEHLQRLHQLLIAPIADLLPSNPSERVIFIPQGRLFLLPFAALQDAQGRYLLEKHTISFAPSVQVLQFIRQHQQARPTENSGNVLLVGNPTMPVINYAYSLVPPAKLRALPGAEKEVQAISQLFNGSALIGPQATKTAVLKRMPEARIIHLATHGLLDEIGDTLFPGAIALGPSGSKPNDGLLTAEELLDPALKLKADLVVLSACDTGQGRITGDGVIGLSRSFITAGVPSVVVSLWAVPDAPTAELMTRFYHNLQQGQNKAQALRQAMLDTKKGFPDPRSWAAFTLIGEAD